MPLKTDSEIDSPAISVGQSSEPLSGRRARGPRIRRLARTAVLLAAAGVGFLAGIWWMRSGNPAAPPGNQPASRATGARRILFYRDPMHPAYKSDKPGIAPDCGMALEPVYASESDGSHPSAIEISPAKQQLMGVVTGEAERSSLSYTIRTTGQVAADEIRVVHMVGGTEGWIREIATQATGTLVKRGDLLAIAYAHDFLPAQQSYIYALRNQDAAEKSGEKSAQEAARTQVDSSIDNLLTMGVSETQIREIARSRQPATNIELRAPITGFVLARNIFSGLRFERGVELARIADLSHVWILADVFGKEAEQLKPGQSAEISISRGGPHIHTRISNSLPQFDSAARTMKVRLEAENSGYALQPGMFVDVEFPVTAPPCVNLPAAAVIDSGVKKTVFVDRGGGFFEPRQVETGRHWGDRIEIIKGISPGERIALAGTFLLDSESRMRGLNPGPRP